MTGLYAFALLAAVAAPGIAAAAQSQPAPGAPYYRYCADARAAGVAPIRRGEPGYAPHLDRDGDGVACEWSTRGSGAQRVVRRRPRRS